MTPPEELAQRVAPTWGWFVVWVFLGSAATFGLISFITPAAVGGGLAILVAVWFAIRYPAFGASAYGAIAGVGRDGARRGVPPASRSGNRVLADRHRIRLRGLPEPVAVAVVGVALIATGVVLQVRRMRSAT